MVLHILFLLPNRVLEGLNKHDDLILESQGMFCWWLNILISLFLDSFQAFNQIYHHIEPLHPPAVSGGILGSGPVLSVRRREV